MEYSYVFVVGFCLVVFGLFFLVWVCCVGLVYSGGFLVVIMRMMGISVRWIVPVVIIMLVVWVCVRWLVVCRVSAVIVIIDAMIVAVSIGLRGFGLFWWVFGCDYEDDGY